MVRIRLIDIGPDNKQTDLYTRCNVMAMHIYPHFYCAAATAAATAATANGSDIFIKP